MAELLADSYSTSYSSLSFDELTIESSRIMAAGGIILLDDSISTRCGRCVLRMELDGIDFVLGVVDFGESVVVVVVTVEKIPDVAASNGWPHDTRMSRLPFVSLMPPPMPPKLARLDFDDARRRIVSYSQIYGLKNKDYFIKFELI